MNELKRALKEAKKLLKDLLRLEEQSGMAFKDFPKSEQSFAKLEMEVAQLRIKQLKEIILEKEKDIKENDTKVFG